MAEPAIKIEFHGGDADRNVIEMRHYALALQGAEEMLSDGLILLSKQRLRRPRERPPILIKAREPEAGSHITPVDVSEAYGVLQLGLPIITQIGADFLYNWVKAVLAHYSGKPSELDASLRALVDLNNAHLASRDRAEERMHEERVMAHEERMLTLDVFREAIRGQGQSADKFSAPVGRGGVTRADLETGPGRRAAVDEPMAEAIREQNKVTWEKISPLNLETDGFRFHTNGLSVRNPESDGFLMATVKDPVFGSEEADPYADAAKRRATIRVLARKGRRNGVLARLEIVEFEGIINDNAATGT